MKQFITTLTLILFTIITFGQEKRDLTISIGSGLINSGSLRSAVAKPFVSFDMDYSMNTRNTLSTNYFSGSSLFKEDPTFSGNPNYQFKERYKGFSVLYKYRFINRSRYSIVAGSGVAIMTHISQFFYNTFLAEAPLTDFALPIRIEMNYKVSNHLLFGVMTGGFINQTSPIIDYYGGLRLSYILK